MSFRKRVWETVEPATGRNRASKIFGVFILALILLNVLAVILESVAEIGEPYGEEFRYFELFSIAVFTLEYLARIWSCVEHRYFSHPVIGRLRFALRFMSLVDLLTFLPFYLPLVGVDLRFARVLRIFRILRVVKIGRYYTSLQLFARVFRSKKEELVLTTCVMLILLVISSCLIYQCEHDAQPKAFASIPAAMWWSIATLTTIGYGDVYPVTAEGKTLAAVIAILGIGMFALPTAILGSGFVEEIQRRKQKGQVLCPHCGERIE